MTGTRKVLPFPAQLDTSDRVIGIDLDNLIEGIAAATAGLPAPQVRTVVTKTQEKPAGVMPIEADQAGERVDPFPPKRK